MVIPVYNEAAALPACLDALSAQTVPPLEVIVVDNNSSDNSAAVAARYPFAKVLYEPRQGVVHARDRGFEAARGEIIGRIDADTKVRADWVENLQSIFAAKPKPIAVTGSVAYGHGFFVELAGKIDQFLRRRLARQLAPTIALQGANMALTKAAWEKVRSSVCRGKGHEDMDISIHLAAIGLTAYDERPQALISFRQSYASFLQFCKYALHAPEDYRRHNIAKSWHMYEIAGFVIIIYPLIAILGRGIDPRTNRFSWRYLWKTKHAVRVNPATFVD